MGGIIMTREEARTAAELMLAYADGKEIEYRQRGKREWQSSSTIVFNWGHYDYRLKKEPTYRPFKGKDECWAEMQKHQPFGWVMQKGTLRQVVEILDYAVCFAELSNSCYGYNEVFEEVQFADGTPFGIKEE